MQGLKLARAVSVMLVYTGGAANAAARRDKATQDEQRNARLDLFCQRYVRH